jgi:hypothetical protein
MSSGNRVSRVESLNLKQQSYREQGHRGGKLNGPIESQMCSIKNKVRLFWHFGVDERDILLPAVVKNYKL